MYSSDGTLETSIRGETNAKKNNARASVAISGAFGALIATEIAEALAV